MLVAGKLDNYLVRQITSLLFLGVCYHPFTSTPFFCCCWKEMFEWIFKKQSFFHIDNDLDVNLKVPWIAATNEVTNLTLLLTMLIVKAVGNIAYLKGNKASEKVVSSSNVRLVTKKGHHTIVSSKNLDNYLKYWFDNSKFVY